MVVFYKEGVDLEGRGCVSGSGVDFLGVDLGRKVFR